MDVRDREHYIHRYSAWVNEFGYSPKSLGWGEGQQSVRFSALSTEVIQNPTSSILDVGCGFGDLYDFLITSKWHGQYTGIDIVPRLVEIARTRNQNLDVRLADLFELSDDRKYDYVISSGIFNGKLKYEDNKEHIRKALRKMFEIARVQVCVDFLSTYVDFQRPQAFHTDPAWALTTGMSLTKRVILRHDYMPYEFALFLYKNSAISRRNVFE